MVGSAGMTRCSDEDPFGDVVLFLRSGCSSSPTSPSSTGSFLITMDVSKPWFPEDDPFWLELAPPEFDEDEALGDDEAAGVMVAVTTEDLRGLF